MEAATTLVVSHCFPPCSDTRGIEVAKRVLEVGVPVDVICSAMDATRVPDYSLARIGGDLVRRFAAVPFGTSLSGDSVTSFVEHGLERAEAWESAQGPYEIVYSRADQVHSGLLAASYKLRHPEVLWKAEFSYPPSGDDQDRTSRTDISPGGLVRRLAAGIAAAGGSAPASMDRHEWCEAATFALADEFVFVSERQRDLVVAGCHDPALGSRARDRSTVSCHPTLPREFYRLGEGRPLPVDRVNIGFFGDSSGGRALSPVLEAFALLPGEVASRLLLHTFTPSPEDLSREAVRAGVGEYVRTSPAVGYFEFLTLADAMDLLLVPDPVLSGSPEAFVPSTWSDLKGCATPIWAVVQEGSSLDEMADVGYMSPASHVTGMMQVLSRVAANQRRRIGEC